MTYIRKPKPPKPELIERKCLKCGRKFIAKGRFNRICPSCAKKSRISMCNTNSNDKVLGHDQVV